MPGHQLRQQCRHKENRVLNSARKWRLPVMAGAALVAGLVTAGGSFALWNTASSTDQAVIASGHLDLSSVGDAPLWQVGSARDDSTAEAIAPEEFLVRPGDTTSVDFDFTATLEGDNMRAALGLDWRRAPDLPEGVAGTYALLDAEGKPVLDHGGDPVRGTLPSDTTEVALGDFDFERESGSEALTLQIALDFADMEDRFGPDSDPQEADLGEFAVVLNQVREGGEPE